MTAAKHPPEQNGGKASASEHKPTTKTTWTMQTKQAKAGAEAKFFEESRRPPPEEFPR
jgi:hypothetical protein